MKKFKFIFGLLLALAAFGQVTSDLYLPSLPAIVDYFHTTNNFAQLSVALYFAGFMISQLVYGPVSDGIGRKLPLQVGLSICLLGSVVCAVSQSITLLILGRLLQGLGSGSAMSLSRSILRDVLTPEEMTKYLSYLAIGGVSLMASAPLLGGYIEHYLQWRVSFGVLLIYNLLILTAVFTKLSETNQHKTLENLKLRTLKKNVKRLLSEPIFVCNALVVATSYGGFIAWLTAGPIVLQDGVGVSAIIFGWSAFAVAMVYCVGSLANAKITFRFPMENIKWFGISMAALSALSMLVLSLMGFFNVSVVVIPMCLYAISTAFIFPVAFSKALAPFPDIAGITSAVFSFIQILGGAFISMLMSFLHDENQFPLAVVLTAITLLALLINGLAFRAAPKSTS